MTRRNKVLLGAAAAVLAVVGVVLVVTGGSDHSNDQDLAAPTRSELESVTGLDLPSSISKYETVRLEPGQVDVRFQIPASDVEQLVAGSKLPPLTSTRVITHPSPLWSLNPTGAIRGTSITRRGARIDLEVVGDDPATVRLSVRAVAPTTTTVQQ